MQSRERVLETVRNAINPKTSAAPHQPTERKKGNEKQ